MTTNNSNYFLMLLFFSATFFYAQNNNLTSSPYSLFGLGNSNDANTGITNSLGKAGIALGSETEINNLNPASLGSMPLYRFFLDIGGKGEYNVYGDKTNTGKTYSLVFSNLSFAFPINEKSGISLSLQPFTEVGYTFNGIVENVDGSQDQYYSRITGSGGLNKFTVNYGRKITPKLNVGLSFKYLFGTITQNETVVLDNDYLVFEDTNFYRGISLGTGLQYQVTPSLNLASVVTLGSSLNASRDREVNRIVNEAYYNIESTESVSISDYKLPVDITFGVKYNYKNYNFISDYKRSFWSATHLTDNTGNYTDSNLFSVGMEYMGKENYNTRNRMRYRIGYYYEDGNLKINNNKIATNALTLGLGVPLGNSMNVLNFSYSYGIKGVVSNILVQEKFHSVTVNLSFADNWFRKRKID
ncbi:hypothetical protein [Flavobacterium sp. J27]|uniref:hypothetical protein n=1 Tax=Flavobacterium sp. J27 TaxID=2060419 RepID=UPI0010313F41|nr:hypothetical protein [Flavobacterium sp. J27]